MPPGLDWATIAAMTNAAPTWIRDDEALARLAAELAAQPVVAMDTESDSLHHFFEKTCLIQVGLADGRTFLIDPLVIGDMAPLGPVLAAPGIRKVFHAADYDIAVLARDFGFRLAGLFDTMLACRFLGWTDFGLAAALHREFGLTIDKGPQRADWSQRPLPPDLEAYAAQDVSMLIPLHERLRDALTAAGRLDWVIEECEALIAQEPVHPSAPQMPDPSRAPGARDLNLRQAAVLAALYETREEVARRLDRPRFKVVSDATLVRIAGIMPLGHDELARIPGVPRPMLHHARSWLDAIRRGVEGPPAEPTPRPDAYRPRTSPIVGARLGRLRAWRNDAAARFGLEPGLFLPQRLLVPVAVEGPPDLDALAAIEGIRRWRVQAFGAELLAALHGTDP
jgi:ribonuclease D